MMKLCRAAALTIILAALVGLTVRPPPLAAAEPPTTVVIFDGSGSMWGRPEGERVTRLVMARDGIRQGLGRMWPQSRVGLMSFGHRRTGDCQDTELIVAPAPLDVDTVMDPLERLNPKGRGPLTKALREAATVLGPQSARASVILVHDGPDNCQLDPCSALTDLRAAHPGVAVHVVSLGLSPEEARTVACLPQATGGRHFVVTTAAEVGQALGEALALAGSERGGPPQPAAVASRAPATSPAAPPAARPGLQLWATLVKGGPPLTAPVNWTVRKAGETGPPLWEGQTAAPLLILPTGRYDVEARLGLVTRRATADAAEGAARSLAMVLDAGTLVLAQPSAGREAALEGAVLTLARIEARGPAEPRLLRNPEAEIAVVPGNYLVSLTSGQLRIERPVGIEAGKSVSLAGVLSLGTLELSAVAAKDGPSLGGVVYAVFEDDPDAPLGRREVARSAAPTPSFRLPAGNYYVTARRGAAEVRDRFTVRAAEVERRILMLEAGRLDLSVRLAGGRLDGETPITHRIERLDIQPSETLTASGFQATFDLAAGQYRIESRVGAGNVLVRRELRVKPGETERVALDHLAGVARLRLVERAGAPPVADASFEVRDRNGQIVWAGLGIDVRVLLFAGRYTVRAESRSAPAERAFDVVSGEERAIEVTQR